MRWDTSRSGWCEKEEPSTFTFSKWTRPISKLNLLCVWFSSTISFHLPRPRCAPCKYFPSSSSISHYDNLIGRHPLTAMNQFSINLFARWIASVSQAAPEVVTVFEDEGIILLACAVWPSEVFDNFLIRNSAESISRVTIDDDEVVSAC